MTLKGLISPVFEFLTGRYVFYQRGICKNECWITASVLAHCSCCNAFRKACKLGNQSRDSDSAFEMISALFPKKFCKSEYVKTQTGLTGVEQQGNHDSADLTHQKLSKGVQNTFLKMRD